MLDQMGFKFIPHPLTHGLIDRPKICDEVYQTISYYIGESSQYSNDYLNPNGQYRYKARHSLERISNAIGTDCLILDIGCGPNHIAYQATHDRHLKKKNFKVVGLDYNIPILQSNLNFNRNNSIGGSIRELPFCDGAFRGVIVNDVLEHLTPDESLNVLNDIRRLLSKNGALYLNIPNRNALVWKRNAYDDPGHVFLPDPEEVKQLLMNAGFPERNIMVQTRGFGNISKTFTQLTGRDIAPKINMECNHIIPSFFGTSILATAKI